MRAALLALILLFTFAPLVAQETTPEGTADPLAGERFTYEDVSFTVDPALWSEVTVNSFAGDDPAAAVPGLADAPHVAFLLLPAAPSPESRFAGDIRVYRFADVTQYAYIVDEINALGALINAQVDLAAYMVNAPNRNDHLLPFLPVLPTSQVIRALAQYVQTDALTGIRYVTAYQPSAAPFTGSDFVYTFQGLSIEAQVYVSIVIPLSTDLFPAEAGDVDMEAFISNLQPYFAESIATLNGATADAFTPPLAVLDALVESVSIGS